MLKDYFNRVDFMTRVIYLNIRVFSVY